MARLTRAESAARTREQLLEAAEKVFAEDGFGGASLEKIAERAGYTRGAVYANFKNKQELFAELLRRQREAEIAQARRALEAGASVRDVLALLRKDGRGTKYADLTQFLLLSEYRLYALRNPSARKALAEVERLLVDSYVEAIERFAKDAGIKLPVPAEKLGLMLAAMENGIAMLAHLDPDRVQQVDFVDAVAALVRLAAPVPRQRRD